MNPLDLLALLQPAGEQVERTILLPRQHSGSARCTADVVPALALARALAVA
jgi:hypothetical protein